MRHFGLEHAGGGRARAGQDVGKHQPEVAEAASQHHHMAGRTAVSIFIITLRTG